MTGRTLLRLVTNFLAYSACALVVQMQPIPIKLHLWGRPLCRECAKRQPVLQHVAIVLVGDFNLTAFTRHAVWFKVIQRPQKANHSSSRFAYSMHERQPCLIETGFWSISSLKAPRGN